MKTPVVTSVVAGVSSKPQAAVDISCDLGHATEAPPESYDLGSTYEASPYRAAAAKSGQSFDGGIFSWNLFGGQTLDEPNKLSSPPRLPPSTDEAVKHFV